jgi:glycosyltransferase involved in cell wall biosynthesis
VKKIKVAQIVTLLELGGAQKNVLHILNGLDPARFDRLLLCGSGAVLDEEARKAPYPVYFLRNLVRPVSPLRDALAVREMAAVLRRERPDVVHTSSSKAGVLGRWAARLAGVPAVVHTFHGFGFTPGQKPWTRAAFILLEKMAAPAADVLVFVSKANQEEARALGIGRPEQRRLILCGVALDAFFSLERARRAPQGIPVAPEHKLVVTIGPFKPQKNLGDFIAAADLVARRDPSARFLMVGDGALRPALEADIRRRGLERVFFLPGWRRDIPGLLGRADAFAMTALWEGLPLALVEAMAAALPCVCNAVDGVPDILADGRNGFLTPPGRPDLTAARLLDILADAGLAARLGLAARASVARDFDIPRMVAAHAALYEELSAGRPPKNPVENRPEIS